MSLQIVITDAGRAAIINAENNGTAPVTISEVGFGSGQYTANSTQTSLVSEIKRLNTISGASVGDDTIHVTARDEGTDAYQVFEFGLYLNDGTLLAVYSQNAAIIEKTAASIALLAVDIVLQSLNPASVTFGDANFINPPATTETPGVVELATNAETQTGTDSSRAVTPSGLSSRTATTTRTGLVELATNAETQTGTDSSRAVTPASLKAALDQNTAPNASTTTKGVVELATNAETQDGTNSSRAVTPSSLASLRQSSQYDTTENRFLVPGSFGWGDISGTPPGNDLNLTDNSVPSALYEVASDTLGKPSWLDSGRRGQVLWGRRAVGGGEFQLLFVEGDNNLYFRTRVQDQWPEFKKVIDSADSADTTTKGIVELATNTETQDGINSTRAVTPSSLNSRTATTTRTGMVELATNTEAQAGTDTSRAVTPAGVKSAIDNRAPSDASTTKKGLVELATDNETETGNDTSRAITPKSLLARTAWHDRIGLVRLASIAEVEEGTDHSIAVTPQGLAQKVATTTAKGLVELATNTEAATGTDTSRAVTPAGVKAAIDSNAPESASTTKKGVVELATNAEAATGTDTSRAVTPAGLKSWSDDRGVYGEDNNEMVGSVAYFITTVAPDGWIKANGAAVSRITYAKLFAKVGTFWGEGNGSTTFNIPDLRGEFIRCWDDGRGVDNARAFGTFQSDEIKEHRHSLPSRDNAGNGNSYIEDADPGGIARNAFTGLEGGSETRPRNVALVAYIKY